MGKGYEYYGALKAPCEQASEKAFPNRATIVRPGYIVGPLDWSGRFNYWCVRFDRGGDILVPGAPSDPIQVIDVRDLGEWMVKLAEDKTTGRFNACGPKEKLTWGEVIEACKKASSAKDIRVHWASLEKMNALKDTEPFDKVEFPIWSPYDGESKGFHTWSNKRAVAAGLTFRPIETIVKDTLAWWKTVPEGDRAKRLGGPTPEQEAAMIQKLG
jgi:2'-hydroxyisoflavone reductase